MLLVAAFSWIGILDSDTIVSLDDATPSHDYYNLHVVPAKPLSRAHFLAPRPHGFLTSQTVRIALQLHLRLRFPGRFLKEVTRP